MTVLAAILAIRRGRLSEAWKRAKRWSSTRASAMALVMWIETPLPPANDSNSRNGEAWLTARSAAENGPRSLAGDASRTACRAVATPGPHGGRGGRDGEAFDRRRDRTRPSWFRDGATTARLALAA